MTTNASGYGRLILQLGQGGSSIVVYADSSHNETVLGSAVSLLPSDTDFTSGPSRVVAAGLRMRSLTSVLNDAGTI